MKKKTSKASIVYAVLAVIFLAADVVGLVLLISGIVNFDKMNIIFGTLLFPFSTFGGAICFVTALHPIFAKRSLERLKRLQEENKDLLTDLTTATADIQKEAVKTNAGAVKEILNDNAVCKHCKAEIDKDSKFCKACGKEQ